MSVGFKNITKCQIKEAISAAATTIKLQNTADYVPFISNPGTYVYGVLRDHENFEIVKITVASSTVNGLSVARGQDGSTARAWIRGTLFYQDVSAAALGDFRQKGTYRTVEYNPNGVLTPAYAGEKVYQDDLTACKKRWWKSIDATSPVWVIIAGTICDGESWVYPGDSGWTWDIPDDWVIGRVTVPDFDGKPADWPDEFVYYGKDGPLPTDWQTGGVGITNPATGNIEWIWTDPVNPVPDETWDTTTPVPNFEIGDIDYGEPILVDLGINYIGPDYWTISAGTYNTELNTYTSAALGDFEDQIILIPAGSWVADFRPSSITIEFTGVLALSYEPFLYVEVIQEGFGPPWSQTYLTLTPPVTSGVPITIPEWPTVAEDGYLYSDIIKLILKNSDPADFIITSIRFE